MDWGMKYHPSDAIDDTAVAWLVSHGATDDEMYELEGCVRRCITAVIDNQWAERDEAAAEASQVERKILARIAGVPIEDKLAKKRNARRR